MTAAPAVAKRAHVRRRPWARWTGLFAAVYVAAWLVGLVLAPASPASDADAAAVHAYYAAQPSAVLTQSLLVHGLAGLALLGLAVALPLALGGRRLAVTGFGVAAALVSLGQAGLGVAATGDVAGTAPQTSLRLFQAINDADSAKLLLLGGFVAATGLALHMAARFPRWILGLSVVLAPLLPLSGAGYLTDNAVLLDLLSMSLPLLLVWAGAVGVLVPRRALR